MKKLFGVILTLLLCINTFAENKEKEIQIVLSGHGSLVSNNPVFVIRNGNVITTTFNRNLHTTIVVSKATSSYNTRSLSTSVPEVISTQTVDAQEFDEVTTIIDCPEYGVKYSIQLVTPEGTLEGEFEIKNEN